MEKNSTTAPYYDPTTGRCPHGTLRPHQCRDGCEDAPPAAAPLDLDAIEAKAAATRVAIGQTWGMMSSDPVVIQEIARRDAAFKASADNVPALVVRVRELEAERDCTAEILLMTHKGAMSDAREAAEQRARADMADAILRQIYKPEARAILISGLRACIDRGLLSASHVHDMEQRCRDYFTDEWPAVGSGVEKCLMPLDYVDAKRCARPAGHTGARSSCTCGGASSGYCRCRA